MFSKSSEFKFLFFQHVDIVIARDRQLPNKPNNQTNNCQTNQNNNCRDRVTDEQHNDERLTPHSDPKLDGVEMLGNRNFETLQENITKNNFNPNGGRIDNIRYKNCNNVYSISDLAKIPDLLKNKRQGLYIANNDSSLGPASLNNPSIFGSNATNTNCIAREFVNNQDYQIDQDLPYASLPVVRNDDIYSQNYCQNYNLPRYVDGEPIYSSNFDVSRNESVYFPSKGKLVSNIENLFTGNRTSNTRTSNNQASNNNRPTNRQSRAPADNALLLNALPENPLLFNTRVSGDIMKDQVPQSNNDPDNAGDFNEFEHSVDAGGNRDLLITANDQLDNTNDGSRINAHFVRATTTSQGNRSRMDRTTRNSFCGTLPRRPRSIATSVRLVHFLFFYLRTVRYYDIRKFVFKTFAEKKGKTSSYIIFLVII